MNKNTFEGSTNPMERNDEDQSDPVTQSHPSVLATLVQDTPTGIGFASVEEEHEAIVVDAPLEENIPSEVPPVDVPAANIASSVALIGPDESEQFRTRWNEIQGRFVDDPRSAVQQADGLVTDVIETIAQLFASEHGKLEEQWKEGMDVSTEDLRQALQHYRSFFNRLVV